MVFLKLADQYLPGYALLPERYRKAFEVSLAGRKFVAVVNARKDALRNFSASNSWWHLFTRDQEVKKKALCEQFISSKADLFAAIENTEAYLLLLSRLVYPIIKSLEPDFCLLTAKQRDSIAKAPFSKPLSYILILESKIEQAWREFNLLDEWQKKSAIFTLKDQLSAIEEHKRTIINEWRRTFYTEPTMELLRQAITEKKDYRAQKKRERQREQLRKKAIALGEFFPLLKEPCVNGPSFIQQIEAISDIQLRKEADNLIHLALAKFINASLVQHIGLPLQYLTVADYTKKQAINLAKLIMDTFDSGKSVPLEDWVKGYKKGLLEQMAINFLLIHGKIWQDRNELKQTFSSSLAYLFSMSKAMNAVKQFMNKFAQAHAFIQATGFATQNESSFLAILDLYNYGRLAEHIDDNKKIFHGLLRPVYSLYTEYREIGLYEKSNLRKIFRILMPMLVAVVFILGISCLLAPFNLPELFLLLIAIPAFIAALALAAEYVNLKNKIYYSLRQRYFGGPFLIPEFQVNNRMLCTFETVENALAIRRFYTNALNDCDQQISFYRRQAKSALLSEHEVLMLKETSSRRHSLCLEWYDLHSNEDLGYEEGLRIALARLQKEAATVFQGLKVDVQNHLDFVHFAVNTLVDAWKLKLECFDPFEMNCTSIKPIASPLFFQPLSKKKAVERLVYLAEVLETIDTRRQNVAFMGN